MKLKSLQMFRVPSLLLAAALQVLPIVRAALPAVQTAGNVLAIIFRWSAGVAAALGGVNAVSGASTTITNPLNVKGTNGVPFQLRLTTAPDQAHYWQATGLPNGLSLVGTSGQTAWKISGTPAATGTFNVGLTAKDQATSPSSRTVTATLVLNIIAGVAPPVISSQPVSLVRTQGQSAAFSVTASGTGTLGYQWRFKNANLPGQSGPSLTVNPVSSTNAGNYDVIVNNSGGSVTSQVATLTVIVPPTAPVITSQPTNQTVLAGQTAGFAVGASGTAPLNFQWRLEGNNLPSRTNATLSFASAATNNAGGYDVIVSNAGGSVTSLVATLVVNLPAVAPTITAQPLPQTVTQGQTATFDVTANGTAPFTYFWKKGASVVSVATSPALNIMNAQTGDAGSYSVIVSNSAGFATSSSVSLTVNPAPQAPFISAQPTNQSVVLNGAASFSVGVGGTAPFGYRWFGNGSLAGTSATLTLPVVQAEDAGSYYVIVTNAQGSVTSSVVSLTLVSPPVITSQPASITNLVGTTARFNVSASSSVAATYQWRKGGTNLTNGNGISGVLTGSLSLSNVQSAAAGSYSVVVGNIAGSVTSQVAVLTVEIPPPPVATLTVQINGNGSVTPNLNGQQLVVGSNYAVTAIADMDATFVNWSGGVTTTVATLNFIMQSNLVLVANFQTVPRALQFTNGTYNGLFYGAGGISIPSSGPFTATTTAAGNYTARLSLAGKKYSFSGRFDSQGRATNSVTRGVLPPLQVELDINDSDPDQMAGRVTDGNWVADLTADRAVFGPGHLASQAGSYTFVLPGNPASPDVPAGSGFGTVIVDPSGHVRMRGVLADGSKMTQTATISKSGEWPLYLALSRSAGSLLGWITFADRSDGDMHGAVNWIKGQQPANPRYPIGFNFAAEINGSRYAAPVAGRRAIDLPNGTMEFSGGNLAQDITSHFQLDANNKVNSVSGASIKLVVAPATGLFKGSVVNPATSKAMPFQGALLQRQKRGGGFFLGATQSGNVSLTK